MLKAVWESFCRSLIRRFDSKVLVNDEIRYLREELEKQRLENFKLTKFILDAQIKPTTQTHEIEEVDWKPAREFKSWEQKKKELEQASWQRMQTLKAEASEALERGKTTAELEAELGINHGTV